MSFTTRYFIKRIPIALVLTILAGCALENHFIKHSLTGKWREQGRQCTDDGMCRFSESSLTMTITHNKKFILNTGSHRVTFRYEGDQFYRVYYPVNGRYAFSFEIISLDAHNMILKIYDSRVSMENTYKFLRVESFTVL